MFERYTERARRVIFFSRYEASQFGSTTIESEHLLLGLVREHTELFQRFLGPSFTGLRDDVARHLELKAKVSTSIDLPLSMECKRILSFAAVEATERFKGSVVSTEHLLLGILREEKSTAARVLADRGLNIDKVRDELLREPMPQEQSSGLLPDALTRMRAMFRPHVGALPELGVVPTADVAGQIAAAVWTPIFGADLVASQHPLKMELKHNVWVVTGAGDPESALYAFILQTDGRFLAVGRGRGKAQ